MELLVETLGHGRAVGTPAVGRACLGGVALPKTLNDLLSYYALHAAVQVIPIW